MPAPALSNGLQNPSAADHVVAFVKNRSLSGRYACNGLVEGGFDFVSVLGDYGGCPFVLVPHFREGFERLRDRRVFLEVELSDDHAGAFEVPVAAEHHLIGVFPYFGDEGRVSQGNAEAFALSDGIERVPFVLAEDFSFLVDEIAAGYFGLQCRDTAFEEAPVVVVRDKADFVALGLAGEFKEAPFLRHFPDFRFPEMTERELGTRETFLGNAPEHITLVFPGIKASGDDVAAVFFPHIGIVAGGDKLAVELVGPAQQRVPFDVGIAEDAGVGRTTFQVFVGEMVDDIVAELIPDVEDVVRKTQLNGHVAGVVDAVEAAAAGFFFGAPGTGVVPGFHRHADDFVALFVEEDGGQ